MQGIINLCGFLTFFGAAYFTPLMLTLNTLYNPLPVIKNDRITNPLYALITSFVNNNVRSGNCTTINSNFPLTFLKINHFCD